MSTNPPASISSLCSAALWWPFNTWLCLYMTVMTFSWIERAQCSRSQQLCVQEQPPPAQQSVLCSAPKSNVKRLLAEDEYQVFVYWQYGSNCTLSLPPSFFLVLSLYGQVLPLFTSGPSFYVPFVELHTNPVTSSMPNNERPNRSAHIFRPRILGTSPSVTHPTRSKSSTFR